MQFLSNIKNTRTPDGKENAEKAFGIMKHINKTENNVYTHITK